MSRAQNIASRGSECLLFVECKYYVHHLGIGLARNFEGLRADICTPNELFVSNIGSPTSFGTSTHENEGLNATWCRTHPKRDTYRGDKEDLQGLSEQASPSTVI